MASSSSSGFRASRQPLRPLPRSGSGLGNTGGAGAGGSGSGSGRPDAVSEAAALIDARFHRAVDIIQSLPKGGPISTTYEEKLMLYSLYKQATEGPVQTPRPGLLDLLGRAKWDAWKKREKLTKGQAQEAYVETLFSILKGFSDRTQAVELMKELREYGKPADSGRGRDAEYASTSSSIRSVSPPPETSGSRRSYHSADAAFPTDNEETPRRRHFPSAMQPITNRPQATGRQREQDLPEEDEEYTSQSEESGSETASGDEEDRYRRQAQAGPSRPTQLQHRSLRQQQYQPQAAQQRFSGPSPYQHPAQYPAPVQAQLPPHLPAVPSDLPRQAIRPGPPSAVPSVSTLPPYAQPPFQQRLSTGTQLSAIQQLVPIAQSTSALQPGPGNRAGPSQANLDRALDSIQTSLAALHERLNQIEQPAPASSGLSISSYIRSSPILQFISAVFSRLLVALRLRAPTAGQRSLSNLLGKALVAALSGVRDLSRDAVAVLFLAAAVASLRSTRGDWRAVIRAWARILALASGVGLAREGGLLAGIAET